MLNRFLADLVDASRRHALFVLLGGLLLAIMACGVATYRLGVTTDTDQMFSASLPWRQRAMEFVMLGVRFGIRPHSSVLAWPLGGLS